MEKLIENFMRNSFSSFPEALMKPETYAPEFVVALQDKTCNEAEKVVFECKVTGEPQPTVAWFHEKVLFFKKMIDLFSDEQNQHEMMIKIEIRIFQTAIAEEASKTIIESEGAIQRLVIVSTDVTSRGQYICLAENAEGKAESKATLTVLGKFMKFE